MRFIYFQKDDRKNPVTPSLEVMHEEATGSQLDEIKRSLEKQASLNGMRQEMMAEGREKMKDDEVFLHSLSSIIAELRSEGWTDEQLNSPEKVAGALDDVRLQPQEREALARLKEVMANPDSATARKLLIEWPQFVHENTRIADAAHAVAFPEKVEKGKEATPEQGAISKFVHEHPVASAGLAILGAYGVYKLTKWIFSSHDSSSKDASPDHESRAWKWVKRGAETVLGVFLVGRLLGSETVREWIKKTLHIDLSQSRIAEALKYLSHGEFKKAWEILWEGAENHELYENIAGKISAETGKQVSWKILKKLEDKTYGSFSGTWDRSMDWINKNVLNNTPIFGSVANFFGLSSDEEVLAQFDTIREYLKKHESEIAAMPGHENMPIMQVLARLNGMEDKYLETHEPERQKELAPFQKVVDAMPEGPKKEVAKKILDLLKHNMVSFYKTADLIQRAKDHNLPTEELEKLLVLQKQALDEMVKIAADKTTTAEMLYEKSIEFAHINDELARKSYETSQELQKRVGWQQAQYLGVTQGLAKGIPFLLAPKLYKEYGKYVGLHLAEKGGKTLLKPFSYFIDKVNGKLGRAPTALSELDNTIEEADKIIRDRKILIDNLDNLENRGATLDIAQQKNRRAYKAEIEGAQADREFALAQKEHLMEAENLRKASGSVDFQLSHAEEKIKVFDNDQKFKDLLSKESSGSLSAVEKEELEALKVQKNFYVNQQELATVQKNLQKQIDKVEQLKSKPGLTAAEIAEEEKYIQPMQEELERLKSKAAVLHTQKLEIDVRKMQELEMKKLVKGSEALEGKISHTQFDLEKEKVFLKGHFERLDMLGAEIRANRKSLEDAILHKAMLLRDVKAGKIVGHNAASLEKEINELLKEHARLDYVATAEFKNSAKVLKTRWQIFSGGKKLTSDVRRKLSHGHIEGVGGEKMSLPSSLEVESDGIAKRAAAHLREWVHETILKQKSVARQEAEKGLFGKIRTLKGRLYFYTPMLALGTILSHDSETSWKEAAGQTVVDMAPVTGTASDIYSVFSGKEMVTGRKLGIGDRAIRGLFAVGGLVCDVTSLAGIGLVGREWLDGLRGAKTLTRAEKVAKEAEDVIKGKRLLEELKEAKTFKTMEAVGKWSGRAAIAGILGQLGYSLIFQPSSSVEITPEMEEVLGSDLQQLDDKDLENVTPQK